MQNIFSHPVFIDAIKDIESLGVKITEHPTEDSVPYAVLGGRSNARWWLIPLTNKKVTIAGLALFQPLLTNAKLIKKLVTILSYLGLGWLWAKPRIYISNTTNVANYFSSDVLSYAYFTGTDSPHRKVAVQVMDIDGNLKGFVKVTNNPRVGVLLKHEASILEHVNELDLTSAFVPNVLFFGEKNGVTVLITDTLKSAQTSSTTSFSDAHLAFVHELEEKTAVSPSMTTSSIASRFRERLNKIQPHLEKIWIKRLNKAINYLEERSTLNLPACLSHGDFTPWNTFMKNGQLYVFDWEYAEIACPPTNDIIHFVLNEPQTRNQAASDKIKIVTATLTKIRPDLQKHEARVLLIIYILTNSMRQIERMPVDSMNQENNWDGAKENAAILDSMSAASKDS